MVQVNLVPDVKLELIRAQRHRNIVISSAIIIMAASIGVVVLLGITFGAQLVYEKTVTDSIYKQHDKFVNKPDIKKTVTIQNQLKSIQETHEQKAMTSRIFALISEASVKDTDNSVSLNSFTIDTTAKTISLVAQTDKRGFDAAEVFRKNIEAMKIYYQDANSDTVPNEFKANPITTLGKDDKSETIASDVVLSDLSYSENSEDKRKSVNFRLTFTYNPILFDEKVDILRIRGLNRGNVTDSYEGLPKTLFSTTGTTQNSAGGNR